MGRGQRRVRQIDVSNGGRGPDDVSVLNGGRFAAGRGAVASRVAVSNLMGAAGVGRATCCCQLRGGERCMVNWSAISVDID